jgi:hypothetical protein
MAGTDRVASAARRARLVTDAPWLGILVAAGAFQFGRGAPIEGIPVALGFAALLADALGWLKPADRVARRPAVPTWVLVVALVVGGAVVALLPEFGWIDAVIVLAVALAAIVPAWGRRGPAWVEVDDRRPLRRAAVAWSAVMVALCVWELVSFFTGLPSARASWRHPALSDLVKPAIDVPISRGVLFAVWLAAGWALVRRGWGRRPEPAEPDSAGSALATGAGPVDRAGEAR